jgi:hypothetical protein
VDYFYSAASHCLRGALWPSFALARINDFKCLDPTAPRVQEGALAISADIEEVDVVFANMWRESIQTTLGIVQAKRMGIPVILIDQHCIDSQILKSLFGDFIVQSEDTETNKLRNEVARD